MGVFNLLGVIVITLLLGLGGGLMIGSFVELRKNEETDPGSRKKGRQLAAIASSVLFISTAGLILIEFFTGGKF